MFVVGIDGGGTKTDVQVMALDGTPLDNRVFGPLNRNGGSEEQVRAVLREVLVWLDSPPRRLLNCGMFCIGTAGISNPGTEVLIRETLASGGYTGKLLLVGDQETALCGALGRPAGIVLIAGTGSICFGRTEDGRTARCGGWGNKIDDEGGGYALGRDALTAIVRGQDGRGPKTMLTELVFHQLGIGSISELIQFIYAETTRKKEIASLAPLVGIAWEQRDEAAGEIVNRACDELALLAETVADTMHLKTGELALTGSVLNQNLYIRRGTEERIGSRFPDLNCIWEQYTASMGAALMAQAAYAKKEEQNHAGYVSEPAESAG